MRKENQIRRIGMIIQAVLILILSSCYRGEGGTFGYGSDGEGGVIIKNAIVTGDSLVIPSEINGKPVTGIGYECFFKEAGIKARYEPGRIRYTPADRHYTPDFILPNGVVIETKGYFAPEDRTKHLLIKQQHPDLDLRFVFQRPRTHLYPGSKSTYASWCEQHGFKWAYKTIPQEWLEEPITETKITAIKEVLITKCEK